MIQILEKSRKLSSHDKHINIPEFNSFSQTILGERLKLSILATKLHLYTVSQQANKNGKKLWMLNFLGDNSFDDGSFQNIFKYLNDKYDVYKNIYTGQIYLRKDKRQ